MFNIRVASFIGIYVHNEEGVKYLQPHFINIERALTVLVEKKNGGGGGVPALSGVCAFMFFGLRFGIRAKVLHLPHHENEEVPS